MKNILNKTYHKVDLIKYDLEDLLEAELDENVKTEISDLMACLQKDADRLRLLEWLLDGHIKMDLYELELKKIKNA